jgi:hypothetical protein
VLTEQTATVKLETGIVKVNPELSMLLGTDSVIPIALGQSHFLHFDVDDQLQFVELLSEQLKENKIINVLEYGSYVSDVVEQ